MRKKPSKEGVKEELTLLMRFFGVLFTIRLEKNIFLFFCETMVNKTLFFRIIYVRGF